MWSYIHTCVCYVSSRCVSCLHWSWTHKSWPLVWSSSAINTHFVCLYSIRHVLQVSYKRIVVSFLDFRSARISNICIAEISQITEIGIVIWTCRTGSFIYHTYLCCTKFNLSSVTSICYSLRYWLIYLHVPIWSHSYHFCIYLSSSHLLVIALPSLPCIVNVMRTINVSFYT